MNDRPLVPPGDPGSASASRRTPLPFTLPKPIEDDPEAQERIRRILEHPSYVRADRDVRFLERSELRPSRLSFDYLKAELILKEHGIASTIVVFGGTRVVEPAAALRRLQAARRALADDPDDPGKRHLVVVAERIVAKSRYYDVAREFGRIVSEERGKAEGELVIVTGGGPGIMEAANRGAFDAGAKSVGLNITLPLEQFPNPYITPELCFQFRYFGIRKLHFMKRAKALVAFPGGYGTFDELFDALTLIQTAKIEPVPVILVGREFWTSAFDARFLADEGVIDEEDLEIFTYAETAREIWDLIRAWHPGLARDA